MFHCLLACMSLTRRPAFFVTVYIICIFSSGAFQNFSLSVFFCKLVSMCFGVVFLMFLLFEVYYWICSLVFSSNLENFKLYLFKYFFCLCCPAHFLELQLHVWYTAWCISCSSTRYSSIYKFKSFSLCLLLDDFSCCLRVHCFFCSV